MIDPVKALGQNCFGQLQSLPRIGALVKALTRPGVSARAAEKRPADAGAVTAIPTGVPAGNAAGPGGTSPLPLVVLLLVVALGGGGALAYRTRGRFTC
jgi:hypothetical protein